jgi:hypothetical protein
MTAGERHVLRRWAVALALVSAAAGCGPSYLAVRPSEPLVAEARGVHADVSRMWLTEDVRGRGLADDVDLVVELRVRNDGARERKVSPGSFSCWMVLDAQRPGETLSLLAGGGGEGAFPGEPPGEGSLLLPVTIPPGQWRDVWAIFHGYRFDGSDRPRRVTLTVPLDDGALTLDLADPARGDLRWELPAQRRGVAVGLRNFSLFAGSLKATVPGTEIMFNWRSKHVMGDVGLVSLVLVQTEGPLQSVTSSFAGTGLVAHLTAPLLSWGAPAEPRQLGVFVGGSATALIEMVTPQAASDNQMMMKTAHAYGFSTLEAGIELDIGALRFAGTPFPLDPDQRSLPRWTLRIGYVQGWGGGAWGGGLLESFRFTF